MKAAEFFRAKEAYGAGFVEIVIWQVPEPVPPSGHPYKYRLVYVVGGKRVIPIAHLLLLECAYYLHRQAHQMSLLNIVANQELASVVGESPIQERSSEPS